MTKLLAYHNDKAVKLKYISRMEAHRKADELVQGIGWESHGATKGCAVGCTFDAYEHSRGVEIGVPEALLHLEDAIFERLPTPLHDRDVTREYIDAAIRAAESNPILSDCRIERATGQRILYHGWNGAGFRTRCGVFGSFAKLPKSIESALDDADQAGRDAAAAMLSKYEAADVSDD